MFRRLADEHQVTLEGLLAEDPVQNLFLIGFIHTNGLQKGRWYGIFTRGELRATVLVLPGRLAVPWTSDPAAAAMLGRHLASRHTPSMVVGPRDAADALWSTWAPRVVAERYYDQRLYVCRSSSPGSVGGFRRATVEEAETVAEYSGRMEEEDLGRNPADAAPAVHLQVVRDRIRNGKTWVIERGGKIVFQITVGTTLPLGCQVGGTYVPPEDRGRGIATDGMRELARRLLVEHGMITLHVNEANRAAVRVYEKAGFERNAPFRLITVSP